MGSPGPGSDAVAPRPHLLGDGGPVLADPPRDRIIESFNKIKNRKIMNIIDEFQDEDRIFFEHEVLKAFGIDVYFDNIVRSLLSLHCARLAVKITDA